MRFSRREILLSSAATFAASSSASSWIRGVATPLSGLIGMNGFDVNPNSDYIYKNFMKGAASFSSTNNVHLAVTDNAGYPTLGTLTADLSGIFVKDARYLGNWRLQWKGKLNLRLSPSQSPNTGFTIVSDPSGVATTATTTMTVNGGGTSSDVTYVDLKFNGVGSTVQIIFLSGGDNTGLSDLRFVRISAPYTGDMAAIDGGVPSEQFNIDFLNSQSILNPAVVRLMDLSPANFSNVTRSTLATQVDCLSYARSQFFQRIWSGDTSTSDGGATYTVAANPSSPVGAYVDGETAQIRMAGAANSGTAPQLEVGTGRGFKVIKNPATGSYGAFSVGQLSLNSAWTVFYDAVADCWVGQSDGLVANAPLAIRVGLSNKLLSSFWHNIPIVYDDASISAEISYVSQNLNGRLSSWLELSNEVWNAGFYQTKTAEARGTALGWSTSSNQNYHSYYALRFCQMVDAAAIAWGSRDSAQLKKVIACQHTGSVSNTNTYRFQGANLAAYGFSSSPNRPIDKCTHISTAPYLSGSCIRAGNADQPSITFSAGEISAFQTALDNYNSGVPAQIQLALNWIDNDFRAGTKNGSLGGGTIDWLIGNILPSWETIAAAANKGTVCYEFGYEGKAPTTTQFTNVFGLSTSYAAICQALIEAYKMDDRFRASVGYAFTQTYLNAPSMSYVVYYNYSGGSQWAVLTGVLGSTPYKSWDAIYQYNH